jgi:mono/diheme cytochrome c family protein
MIKYMRPVAWVGPGVLVVLLVLAVQHPAHALPEFADRTGQPCATCHVNPAGGGPRTLRSMLWVAEGRPDQVPGLPGSEEKPGEAALDGQALFEKFTCSGCHGLSGEGGAGPALNQAELPADKVGQVTRSGTGAMMGYGSDVMSDSELEAVVQFVQALGRGEVEAGPALEKGPLPPAQLSCGAGSATFPQRTGCGGN